MHHNGSVPMRAHSFGQWGETKAAEYLQQLGYTIVARNWRTKFGEIDIIALHNTALYFFEVKSRTTSRLGQPYEAITWRKRQNCYAAARLYVQQHPAVGHYAMHFGFVGYTQGRFTIWPNGWS